MPNLCARHAKYDCAEFDHDGLGRFQVDVDFSWSVKAFVLAEDPLEAEGAVRESFDPGPERWLPEDEGGLETSVVA